MIHERSGKAWVGVREVENKKKGGRSVRQNWLYKSNNE